MCTEQNKVENNSADIFKTNNQFKEKIIKTIVSHPIAVTAAACSIFVISNAVITKHCIASAIYDANKKTLHYMSKNRPF